MTKVLVTEGHLRDIAGAIRGKLGGSDTYTPGQMAAAIGQIHGEPMLQSKTVTENGTVTPDSGYDGLSQVVVNVASGKIREAVEIALDSLSYESDAGIAEV